MPEISCEFILRSPKKTRLTWPVCFARASPLVSVSGGAWSAQLLFLFVFPPSPDKYCRKNYCSPKEPIVAKIWAARYRESFNRHGQQGRPKNGFHTLPPFGGLMPTCGAPTALPALFAGLVLTLCIGGADQTRFNASLKGIAGASSESGFLEESFMVDEFCAALGRFVMEFARAEQMTKDVLAAYAKLSAPAARAVLDGMRLKPTLDKIRRLHEAEGISIHPRMQEAFAQLAAILSMRDKILHQGFEIAEETVTTTNWASAHVDRNIKVHELSVEMIESMTADLGRIQVYMIYWGPADDITPEFKAMVKDIAHEPQPPWLYKPPQPTCGPGMLLGIPPEQQPQQPPSQA